MSAAHATALTALRAAIMAAERQEATDAANRATPGEASRAGSAAAAAADEGKFRPGRKMRRAEGRISDASADATGCATAGAVSHGPVEQAKSQGSSRLGIKGGLNGVPCDKCNDFAKSAEAGCSFASARPL